jgi:hypothetical protein
MTAEVSSCPSEGKLRSAHVVVQETTVASVVAAAVFLGAYGNALHQLRFLKTAAATHASKATSTGATGSFTARQELAGCGSTRPVVTFKEFVREMLPVALVHSQALAVSVVFSGFVHGATNGFIAENRREEKDSK